MAHRRTVGAALLLALGGLEAWLPGWNGLLAEPSAVTADGARVSSAIFFAAAVMLFCGGTSR